MPGLSLINGRYIYVRGLGERYSSVLLNGAQIPSPDFTRRVVPLDLFPNELLDGIIVQKSYSPDMPGEFGGGTVLLRTREVPQAPFFRVQGTLGYTDGTTFEDGLRYDGGGRDWTGYDDGTPRPAGSLAAAIADGSYLRPQSANNPGRSDARAAAGLRTRSGRSRVWHQAGAHRPEWASRSASAMATSSTRTSASA